MGGAGPHRRRIDERRDALAVWAPPVGADPLSRASLTTLLDQVLASAHEARRSVTVVVAEARGGVGAEEAHQDLVTTVRRFVRDTDMIWPTGRRSLAVVLVDADGPSGETAVRRIRGEIAGSTRLGIALGRATAAPGIRGDELVDLATANLFGLKN